MQQFQVPQFIEVEDKLVGPLTFRQFIYLLGGGGGSFLLWRLLSPYSTILAVIAIAPVASLALALAFYKINNRPFIAILESGFKYFMNDRLYIWSNKETQNAQAQKAAAAKALPPPTKPIIAVPKLSESKLRDIAWSLDINEKIKR